MAKTLTHEQTPFEEEIYVAIEKTEVKVAPAPVEVAPEEGISVEVAKKEQGPKEGGKTLGLSDKGKKTDSKEAEDLGSSGETC